MKEIQIVVSDEEWVALEQRAHSLEISVQELLQRSVVTAVAHAHVSPEPPFQLIGFGMWADRPEMQDAAQWVADVREREWTR